MARIWKEERTGHWSEHFDLHGYHGFIGGDHAAGGSQLERHRDARSADEQESREAGGSVNELQRRIHTLLAADQQVPVARSTELDRFRVSRAWHRHKAIVAVDDLGLAHWQFLSYLVEGVRISDALLEVGGAVAIRVGSRREARHRIESFLHFVRKLACYTQLDHTRAVQCLHIVGSGLRLAGGCSKINAKIRTPVFAYSKLN